MPHATARRLLALAGDPPSFERIARRIGLRVIRYTFPEAYLGSYIPQAQAVLLNRVHPLDLQRAMLAEAIMHHSLPGRDQEAIHQGTLHLLSPELDWPDVDAVGAPGTLVGLPRTGEPPFVWETDASFRIQYISPEFAEWLGWPVREMLGHRLSEFVAPGENVDVTRRDRLDRARTIQPGERYATVSPMRRADGTLWLMTSMVSNHPRHSGGFVVSTVPFAQLAALDAVYEDIGRLLGRPSLPRPPRLTVGLALSFGYAVADLASDGRIDGQIRLVARACAQAVRALAAR